MAGRRNTRSRIAGVVAAGAVALCGSVLGLATTVTPAGAVTYAPIPTATSDDGSYVISEVPSTGGPFNGQVIDISIHSTAMQNITHAFLMLPQSWTDNPTETFPVMYMLSGAGTSKYDWASWIAGTGGQIESLMSNRNVITVMPEDADAGFYTDWFGKSKIFTLAPPEWETFHTQELPQLLARGYRANGVNTIAGISDAGVGVIDYPARHPGLYQAAACLSCMLNTQTPGSIIVVQQAESRIGDNQNGPFGDPVTNSSVWAAHNPVVQIPKFATSGTKLWLGAGNGFPGPGDSGFALDAYVYESTALSQSQGFATKAKAAGIPVTTDWWGNGQHDWAAWTLHFPTAFAQTLAPAMGVPGT